MLVLCNFLRKLMVSNKKIHRALRTHTTLMNNTHWRNFHFHHLPKLYFGFNVFYCATAFVKIIHRTVVCSVDNDDLKKKKVGCQMLLNTLPMLDTH